MNPTPTPKPGPRPGPRPGVSSHPVPAAPVASTTSDPSAFGHVDDDGRVFAIGLDGTEREIGSWQAGTPAEGLAHYGVRYDDLATEVALLATRISAQPEEHQAIKKSATELKESLPTATVIGDLKVLDDKLAEIITSCDTAAEKTQEERKLRREKAISRKKELIEEAERIAAEATEWKKAGDRLHDILEEWKTIRGIERKTDNELWRQYAKARDSFNRRRGAHFAELDRTHAQVKRVKQELIEKARSLQDSTDWGTTAKAFAALMSEWKAAGHAQRSVDNKLWAQFKAAQDHFFDARHADAAKRDEEFEANAQAKQKLLDEYTPLITPEKDLEAARTKLRELQDRWEQIGHVPRGRIKHFEQAISELEQRVSKTADEHWRRTDPEAQARAAQFVAKVEDFTAQAQAAEAKGDADKAAYYRAQAAQWQEWADAASSAIKGR